MQTFLEIKWNKRNSLNKILDKVKNNSNLKIILTILKHLRNPRDFQRVRTQNKKGKTSKRYNASARTSATSADLSSEIYPPVLHSPHATARFCHASFRAAPPTSPPQLRRRPPWSFPPHATRVTMPPGSISLNFGYPSDTPRSISLNFVKQVDTVRIVPA